MEQQQDECHSGGEHKHDDEMDQPISDCKSESEHDALPSADFYIESRLEDIIGQQMSTDDAISKMIPKEDCHKLAYKASCAVVYIACSRKVPDTTVKDTTNFIYTTGFIINSDRSTLIITCADFLTDLFKNWSIEKINLDGIISVGFFDKQAEKLAKVEPKILGKIVYVDFATDICLLEADEVKGDSMIFGGLEYETDQNLRGRAVCAVSHPTCHEIVHYYIFTMGRMGHRCLPMPTYRLEDSCDCLVYRLPMNYGSSGAPVFDSTGTVVAMHSSFYKCLNFGIGLKSIKKALMRYFELPKELVSKSTHEVLRLGLEKQRKDTLAPLSYKMDKLIFDSKSEPKYDSSASDLESELIHLEVQAMHDEMDKLIFDSESEPKCDSSASDLGGKLILLEVQAMHNEDQLLRMIPHKECNDLADRCSRSVVVITCWKKLLCSNSKDSSQWVNCTGFIIHSDSTTTLIMSCAHFILDFFKKGALEEKINLGSVISVDFFDTNEAKVKPETRAEVVYIESSRDICLLTVNVGEREPLTFGGLEYEDDRNIKGLHIFTVSHPLCHGIIQPFTFTLGRMSQSCFPVPTSLLAPTSHCVVHDLAICSGSSGGPILDDTGVVISIISSYDNAFSFGVGLRSVRYALMKYFKLPKKYYKEDANEILKKGIEMQRVF